MSGIMALLAVSMILWFISLYYWLGPRVGERDELDEACKRISESNQQEKKKIFILPRLPRELLDL